MGSNKGYSVKEVVETYEKTNGIKLNYRYDSRRKGDVAISLPDCSKIKSLKKVVYTVLIGNYDVIHSIIKENGYDYYMFTDQKIKNNTLNWTILNVEQEINSLNRINRIKCQRFYKTHPHLFFKDYDLSIYFDANYESNGNLDEFLIRILSPKLSIYILEHPFLDSINNEFEAVVNLKKESKKNIIPIKERYNKERFQDNYGHAETCLIVRKHNKLNCIDFMEGWFYEIKYNSHRDQLSFNYILWKTGFKIVKYIPKYFTELYFKQNSFHLMIEEFQ